MPTDSIRTPPKPIYAAAAFLAGLTYSLSFQKYANRDALSNSPGLQGFVESGCLLLPAFAVYLLGRNVRRKTGMHPAFLWLLVYGLFALASSARSFSPVLSLTKITMLGAALLLSYLIAELDCTPKFFSGVYFGYLATVVGGYLLAFALPKRYPMFSVDEFSGRTQLDLWSTHPNTLAEMCGLLFLVGVLLPIGARWYTQLLLLGTNLLAGEKTSTIALFLVAPLLLFSYRKKLGRHLPVVLIVACVGSTGLILYASGVFGGTPASVVERAGVGIYGNQASSEASGFDGRTEVWKHALTLTDQCIVLGFGLEGAREVLLESVSWAGHAHNGYIQAMLEAGIPGLLALLAALAYGFFGSMTTRWDWNLRVAAIYVYILILGITGPIFDASSYITEVVLVQMLYVALHRRITLRLDRSIPLRELTAS